MSVYDCWKCSDTGSDHDLGFCDCSHGRKASQRERAPYWPSCDLLDAADNAHAERMSAESKCRCLNCDLWYPQQDVTAHICNNCRDDMDYPRKLAMGVVK